MKYFLDTEFHEGFKKPISWLPTFGKFNKPYHSIDLISIGIVDEDGREYYAISKDFDLKAAWNAYDLKPDIDKGGMKKIYWLRENVLKPIFKESHDKFIREENYLGSVDMKFDLNNTTYLIKKYGKSNKQISQGIVNFICPYHKASEYAGLDGIDFGCKIYLKVNPPEFYGYYADYDWVVFCSLFGKMINLPTGFPMHCRDLKQMLDEKAEAKDWYYGRDIWSNNPNRSSDLQSGDYPAPLADKIEKIKRHDDYPQQENEHDALSDARWNKKLYNFIKSI